MHTWKERFGIELSAVSFKEKFISALGGIISIFILVFLARHGLDGTGGTCVIASMGASAVLLFAVPHGQLSQPWPVIAGHGLSALVGVFCARHVPYPDLAAACAVGLSIGVMHQFKCIHPPGGATALTAVIGGPFIQDLGYAFVLFPILLNAFLLIAVAVMLNACFTWRRYPAFLSRRPSVPRPSSAPSHEEVVAALRSMDSFVDITEDDLVRLCQLLASSPATATARKKRQDRTTV